jgi:uncharacterized protein YcbK (DUF882 family)
MSDTRLATLDAAGREAARWLVAYARAYGIPVVVTSARRTAAEQAALTPARGLYKASPNASRHVSGRAFDLGISGYQWDEIDPAYWRWLGSVWKSLGGRWGGDFQRPDPIHFDW